MTHAKITSQTVRDDFNSIEAVIHYTRAAHSLGLWESERILIERFFPDRSAALVEAGCGAGRATLGLWALGYRNITAFDFAEELLEQAQSLARERGAEAIRFLRADATSPELCHLLGDRCSSAGFLRGGAACPQDTRVLACDPGALEATRPTSETDSRPAIPTFAGALFLFNGLMQIPGREGRRAAMRGLHRACRPGAPFLFSTHDRDDAPEDAEDWAREIEKWRAGTQDPHLVEFGDRYMTSTVGRIFMHLPDRTEIREDLEATGWRVEFTAMRREIARESRGVLQFSDECRFWVARALKT